MNLSDAYPVSNLSLQSIDKRLKQSILDLIPEEEARLRIQLAALYRIFSKFGWTDMIYNHITVRIPNESEFLINPFGLLYHEITASSLLKVNYNTDQVTGMSVVQDILSPNRAGYVIHSAIHEARQDIHCIAHVHQHDVVAVSCDKRGLILSNQQALQLGPITYHDYEGIVVDENEKERLVKDLGEESKILILRNHGVLVCGQTIGEALLLMHYLIDSCKIQVMQGRNDLILPSAQVAQKTYNIAKNFNKEGFGNKELSAYMRVLDREDPSYRT